MPRRRTGQRDDDRAAFYTNGSLLGREAIDLPIGRFTFTIGIEAVTAVIIEVVDRPVAERPDGEPEFMLATGGSELLDDAAAVFAFAANVACAHDRCRSSNVPCPPISTRNVSVAPQACCAAPSTPASSSTTRTSKVYTTSVRSCSPTSQPRLVRPRPNSGSVESITTSVRGVRTSLSSPPSIPLTPLCRHPRSGPTGG